MTIIQTMLEARKTIVAMLEDPLLADVSKYELLGRLDALDNKIGLEKLYNLPSYIH